MKKCLVFPGQGSQAIGMGKDLFDNYSCAREVFEEVDSELNFPLSSLMFEGDIEKLNMTENTQPALMCVSIAAVRVLEHEMGKKINEIADYLAGHSLGEYSALCAGGALSLAQCAKLLKKRGAAMQSAAPKGIGAMAAILGLTFCKVDSICKSISTADCLCSAANDNIDGQVVISGHTKAVLSAVDLLKEKGAKRAIMLAVSAPFHCELMRPALDVMQLELKNALITTPTLPIITNVLASATSDIEQLRAGLIEQICARVRWRESLNYMLDKKVSLIVEVGAGKVLSAMLRRLDGLDAVSLNSAQSIKDFCNS